MQELRAERRRSARNRSKTAPEGSSTDWGEVERLPPRGVDAPVSSGVPPMRSWATSPTRCLTHSRSLSFWAGKRATAARDDARPRPSGHDRAEPQSGPACRACRSLPSRRVRTLETATTEMPNLKELTISVCVTSSGVAVEDVRRTSRRTIAWPSLASAS